MPPPSLSVIVSNKYDQIKPEDVKLYNVVDVPPTTFELDLEKVHKQHLLSPYEYGKYKLEDHYKRIIKVTNATLKVIELYQHEDVQYIFKRKSLNSCHIAEFPGTFIIGLFIYMFKIVPGIVTSDKWKWIGTSYGGEDNTEANYLGDHYNMYKNHPDNWYLGDVTQVEHSDQMLKTIEERGAPKEYQLVTGDIGLPVEGKTREVSLHCEQLGQFYNAILMCADDGAAILKMFQCSRVQTYSILVIALSCFKKVRIIKPYTSRAGNRETYWMMTHYDRKIGLKFVEAIKNIMPTIRKMRNAGELLPMYVPTISPYLVETMRKTRVNNLLLTAVYRNRASTLPPSMNLSDIKDDMIKRSKDLIDEWFAIIQPPSIPSDYLKVFSPVTR